MEQREYKDLSSMSVAMTQVGKELNEEIDKGCETRSGWINDRVNCCRPWIRMHVAPPSEGARVVCVPVVDVAALW